MTADEARARAKECKDRANATHELTVKSINEYLAYQWLLLADRLEREGRT